jgi:hypothetical protein
MLAKILRPIKQNTNHRKKGYYSGEGVLVCGEEEERWLPSGNQSDNDAATCQKNQPDSVISDGDWYSFREFWQREEQRVHERGSLPTNDAFWGIRERSIPTFFGYFSAVNLPRIMKRSS